MSYEDFYDIMEGLAHTGKAKVFCFQDKDKGIFVARFDDGTQITMPKGEFGLTVKWGSGHTSTKDIREFLPVAV